MTAAPALIVSYDTTQDNLDGSPWPPDGGDLWSVVKRANGSTTWRRVTLSATYFRTPVSARWARENLKAKSAKKEK